MKSREGLFRFKEFQVEEKRRQFAQIETMIADFQSMASELDNQIQAEHARTGISDNMHFAYSTFAKAATARRDNLFNSIKDLETQMSGAQEALTEALEELKKIELLAERGTSKGPFEAELADQDELDTIALQRRFAK